MIQFNECSFRYKGGRRNALDGITLNIGEGEFVGVTGASGAGKSTLTYAVSGLIPHHFTGDFYGSVTVNGLDTVEVKPEEIARFVGEVFQDIDSQMVSSIVEDEILFGMENFGLPHDEIGRRLEDTLSLLGIEDLRRRQISSLSGGQKQKVAIAAILALQPDVILLDEPTGELDPESSVMIFELLKALNRDYGKTVVVVEQKIMLLCSYVNRIILMEKGRVAFDGPTGAVAGKAGLFREQGINIPRVTELGENLRAMGLYNGQLPLTLEGGEKMAREVMDGAGIS